MTARRRRADTGIHMRPAPRLRPARRAGPPTVRRPTVDPAVDGQDVLIAAAVLSVRTAVAAVRLAAVPARLAVRAPVVGGLLERRLQAAAIQARSARVAVQA